LSTEPVIVATKLGRRFGSTVVVENVDLTVRGGEVLGLIGPNGGGKSTTLLLFAGLIAPTEGEVRVAGVHAHELALQSAGSVGLITPHQGLYPLLTGRENLEFFGGLNGLSKAEVARRAGSLLDELGMTEHLERRTRSYSSGMKQKLSLVRARLLDPKVLLLDEPTANLDPISASAIYQVVRREADAGLAVVLVTHDLQAAESLCERVVLLKRTVMHTEDIEGERGPPPVGRLFGIYRELGGES
jgi:ABC-2 type transport system ATP-binding protein